MCLHTDFQWSLTKAWPKKKRGKDGGEKSPLLALVTLLLELEAPKPSSLFPSHTT